MVKDGDQRKRQLEEQIDQLNEECAKLSAQGRVISRYFPMISQIFICTVLVVVVNCYQLFAGSGMESGHKWNNALFMRAIDEERKMPGYCWCFVFSPMLYL